MDLYIGQDLVDGFLAEERGEGQGNFSIKV